MDCLTIIERVKRVKTHYKSTDSMFRALRADHGRHNRPFEHSIDKIMKKFDETTLETDLLRPHIIETHARPKIYVLQKIQIYRLHRAHSIGPIYVKRVKDMLVGCN